MLKPFALTSTAPRKAQTIINATRREISFANRDFAKPLIIKCTAPIRICDLGGWTDTWFAGNGKVLTITVFPSVEVTLIATKQRPGGSQIKIFAENYHEIYNIRPNSRGWSRHPLIEAAFKVFHLPKDLHLEATVFSEAPAGASTGTSAAVSVAILGALDELNDRTLTGHEIARKAHFIESKLLGIQSGVQDQISSAYGGINYIEITHYPEASVSPVVLKEELAWELESRLLLIFLGKPHSSSRVHEMVIQRLTDSPNYRRFLQPLREAATHGKNALLRGDLKAFGQAMIENTQAQRQLHPELVGAGATRVIEIARTHGVDGFKVNGAGGAGGSVTLLLRAAMREKQQLIDEIQKADADFRLIPLRLAPQGLRRWKVVD